MSEHYYSLLDATIGHLESLKKDGIRYLNLRTAILSELQKPVETVAAPSISIAAPRPPITAPVAPPVRPVVAAPRPQPPPPPPAVQPAAPVMPKVVAPVIVPPAARPSKEAGLAALNKKVASCLKCPNLAAARTNVVFGVGNINATLMFVGEAPGADEDRQGEPFVGAAGQLLTRIIGAMGFSRESVYIANILKCRPDTPGQTSGNRKPTLPEMQTCLPFLREQIELIGPTLIVALGATAVEGLLGRTEGITRLRGHFQSFQGIPVMPTYHPAYLLHNQAMSEKRKVWEDMLQVLGKLGAPITDKQRAYFSKAV